MTAKTCERPDCGRSFTPDPYHPRQRFCEPRCYNIAKLRRKREAARAALPPQPRQVCARPGCRKTFAPRTRKQFCTRDCEQQVAQRRRRTPWASRRRRRTCPTCGIRFLPVRHTQVYHAPECRTASRQERRRTHRWGWGWNPTPEQQAKQRDRALIFAIRRRMRAAGNFNEPDWTATLSELIVREGNLCYLHQPPEPCIDRDLKRWNHPHYPTIDHRIPVDLGGR